MSTGDAGGFDVGGVQGPLRAETRRAYVAPFFRRLDVSSTTGKSPYTEPSETTAPNGVPYGPS